MRLILRDENATAAFASVLAGLARNGDIIALFGGLGAGKTSFARAFINACARARDLPEIDVPSPTFTLVQPYDLKGLTIHHFDLYRLTDAEEALELGIEDALAEGLCLIEWPDRLGDLLPDDALEITLDHGEAATARTAELGFGRAWQDRIGGALEPFAA